MPPDEIEAALAKLEADAPMTPEPGDEGYVQQKPAQSEQQQVEAGQQQDQQQVEAGQQQQPPTPNEIEDIKKRLDEVNGKFTTQQGATAAERAKRRQIEAELAQEREQTARFRQMLAAIQQRQRMGNIPDPEENVVEALKYERALRLAREQQDQQYQQTRAQANQQIQFVNNLRASVEDFETEFRETTPDYDDAAEFLVSSEQKRLEMAGVPKEEAEVMSMNWAINMANMMIQRGKNPAQVAYEAAKMMGYTPKQAAAQDGGAAAAAVAAAAGQQQTEAQRFAAQKSGQEAAKTISGGGVVKGDVNSLAYGNTLEGAAFDSWAESWLKKNR